MNTILNEIKNGNNLSFGGHSIFLYDDGDIGCRHKSSLMGPFEKPTLAGLKRLLKWIDSETQTL